MAVNVLNRSVVLVLYLYLMLQLKPFKPHHNIFDGRQVLMTALDAHRRIYRTRNMPGIDRHSRQMQSESSTVKFMVGFISILTFDYFAFSTLPISPSRHTVLTHL